MKVIDGRPIAAVDEVRGYMRAGRWREAILRAATSGGLGAERGRILSAREALLTRRPLVSS